MSPAAMKAMPEMKDTTTQHMPAMKDTSMKRMPGMKDTAMKDMPGMKDTSAQKMPAMKDTGMKSMPNMPAASPAADTATMKSMDMPGRPVALMSGMTMQTPDPLGVSMDRMGSGTTWVPDAAPIPSIYFTAPGHWDITGHGFAYGQYNKQGGPRGDQQFGSLNWMMLMASHSLAGGRFQARTMLSLDAASVTTRGYPLLLQSGEAIDGASIHDRQHPHDLFMELSALYEVPVTESVGVIFYAAPSGEPAIGPVAFMHRPSAMDNPTAPIGHHWQDATHIAFGVLSAGVFTHTLKLEGSIFNGREPDERRFNFDPLILDSYSGRLTWNPTTAWSLTAGYGFLKSPEALDPSMSMHRAVASALHGATLGTEGQWSAALIYGVNSHSTHPGLSHSLLLESEAVLDATNTILGRAEYVQKNGEDLVVDTPALGFASDRQFEVGALSLGYIRDVARAGAGTLGLGLMGTVNIVPSALSSVYGSRTPVGVLVFLRLRPFRSGANMGGMNDMKMANAPR